MSYGKTMEAIIEKKENKAYEQGKADGAREMLDVILDMWYQFAYVKETKNKPYKTINGDMCDYKIAISWYDGGLSALEMASIVTGKQIGRAHV